MGIKGTVRRTTDGHLIHANIDTDIIISEETPTGSTKKPEELYRVIERFAQGDAQPCCCPIVVALFCDLVLVHCLHDFESAQELSCAHVCNSLLNTIKAVYKNQFADCRTAKQC